jgi:hypothetical protein
MTGNGVNGAAPIWGTIAAADIPTLNQNTTGSAATLTTSRNINGTAFNGSVDITVTAAAGTLTGTALNSTVTASSLTSVGTLGSLSVTGAVTGSSFNSITGLSSTTPVVAGTAAIGTGTTVARADHVHPAQAAVTSVATSGTVSGLTLTGGTITTTGTITLGGTLAVTASNFASQTAATFLAAPNAAAGVPTFRTIVAADIPTLNQSTTGNAGTVTNGVYTNAANTLTSTLTISNGAPIINLFETDQTLPAGRRRIVADGNTFSVRRNTATAGDFTSEVYDINSDSAGNFTASGNVTAYSDIRLKKDLLQIPNALDKVQQLTGYIYTRIDTGEKQTGLVAQDVQKVLPEGIVEGEYLSVAYGNLVGLLVEAIKELRAEVAALKENK